MKAISADVALPQSIVVELGYRLKVDSGTMASRFEVGLSSLVDCL